jgi:hypothetical protein
MVIVGNYTVLFDGELQYSCFWFTIIFNLLPMQIKKNTFEQLDLKHI